MHPLVIALLATTALAKVGLSVVAVRKWRARRRRLYGEAPDDDA